MRFVFALALLCLLGAPAVAQDLDYPHGEKFPRPTAAQLDTLLMQGLVPRPLDNGAMRAMYWPRASFVGALRGAHRKYMTQAIRGGPGLEADVAIPFGPTDYGLFAFGRIDDLRVSDPTWLGWPMEADRSVLGYGAGAGIAMALPLRHPQASFPASMSIGAQLFKPRGSGPVQKYVTIEPSFGFRYRLLPAIAALARIQPSWMISTDQHTRSIGVWGLSLGIEISFGLDPQRPLQSWVPPLVVNAQDVVQLLTTLVIDPVNIFDRNLDFINTEMKPVTAFGWYDLGFYGEVRGTVMASSRASSGNVTALDIRIDSADRRGFRVTRNASMVKPETAEAHRATSLLPADSNAIISDTAALQRLRSGEYAFRPPDELGIRYIRVELFPQAKGPLELIPSVGSRVVIKGDLRWDGDGHLELHPRKPTDTRVVTGEFLNSDDPIRLE